MIIKCQSFAPESESSGSSSKASQARNARLRGRRGKQTVEEMSEIRSEMTRFQCAYDDAERTGEREDRWHVVSIAGARREKSYGEKLLQAFEKDVQLGRWDEGRSLDVMTPVVQYEYEEAETGKVKRKTGRWPATDVLWVRCVLDNQMKRFLRRQTFIRNIFSGEPVVHLKDFAFQEEYDQLRSDDEQKLLTCTDMLRRAQQVECHSILDPELAGFDVHTQLTELFHQKYAHLSPEDENDAEIEIERDQGRTKHEEEEKDDHSNMNLNRSDADAVAGDHEDEGDDSGFGLWG
jgi:hypothetical protein